MNSSTPHAVLTADETEARRRVKLLIDYFKCKRGRNLSDGRRHQLRSIVFDSALGATLETQEQLHVLRQALDEVERLQPAKLATRVRTR